MRIISLEALHLPIDDINHLFYTAETTKDFTSKEFDVAGKKFLITKINDENYRLAKTKIPDEKGAQKL